MPEGRTRRTSSPSGRDAVAEGSDYLGVLAERVRDLRARRGMTRKMLARDSGVSERYLAQVEGGHGNISILRLCQIARAMGVAVEDLVRAGPESPPELTLLIQYLSRLSPARLDQARTLLTGEFETRSSKERIALIGLRGAGKTSLGNMLARSREVPFIELTKVIEQQAGITVSEIFSLYGQAAYRRYERRALQSVIDEQPRFVLVPGGSIVSETGTFELLLSHCFTVWLKASPEEHMARVIAQGDNRPMRDNRESMMDLKRILAGREPMYRKADVTLDTSGSTVAQSLSELSRLLER